MIWEEIIAEFGEELVELAETAARYFLLTVPVNSTAIEELEYNTHNGEMSVTMTDGSTWPYPAPGRPAITQEQFQAFVNAPSKGVFYNLYVRGKW